jgi:hypothetical protein
MMKKQDENDIKIMKNVAKKINRRRRNSSLFPDKDSQT